MEFNWVVFVGGLLVGWLLEWIIDWIFWRKGHNEEHGDADLQARLDTALAESGNYRAQLDNMGGLQAEADELKAGTKVSKLETQMKDLQAQAAEATASLESVASERDNLSQQLKKLRNDFEGSKQRVSDLQYELNDLRKASGVGVAASFVQPSAPEAPVEVEVAVPEVSIEPEPLEKITGIGPVYQQRLWAKGILTFAQLAEMADEEIARAIEQQDWQGADFDLWREEARKLSEGLEL